MVLLSVAPKRFPQGCTYPGFTDISRIVGATLCCEGQAGLRSGERNGILACSKEIRTENKGE